MASELAACDVAVFPCTKEIVAPAEGTKTKLIASIKNLFMPLDLYLRNNRTVQVDHALVRCPTEDYAAEPTWGLLVESSVSGQLEYLSPRLAR